MRLIDADALIIRLKDEMELMIDGIALIYTQAAINELKHAPTVYAVEVIRCKDCKYQDKGQNDSESWNQCGYRPWLYIPTDDEHYCANAERRQDG